MKKQFTINGKKYESKVFDFNMLCEMEDAGITLETIVSKPMKTVRAYFTVCYGGDPVGAGREIEQHIINGGDMTELMQVMSEAMDESGFFQAIQKRTEQSDQKSESEKA